MNRPELFQKSVDTLLDAYNKRELRHGSCSACAVGNLLSDIACEKNIPVYDWSEVFMFAFDTRTQTKKSPEESIDKWGNINHWLNGIDLINSSGYTTEELMKIEYAFETAGDRDNEQYKGLCAVLEVLKEIHEKEDIIIEREKLDTLYENRLGDVCSLTTVF